MPAASTPVQHYKQSRPGMCLPACARMVLAALGDEYAKDHLASVMGSYEFGTPARRVTQLNQLGYKVQFGTFTLDALRDALAHGLFPIVFVKADELPWADFGGFHALVLVSAASDGLVLHDPALDDGPSQMSIAAFMLAWDEFDGLAAVISR